MRGERGINGLHSSHPHNRVRAFFSSARPDRLYTARSERKTSDSSRVTERRRARKGCILNLSCDMSMVAYEVDSNESAHVYVIAALPGPLSLQMKVTSSANRSSTSRLTFASCSANCTILSRPGLVSSCRAGLGRQ